MGYGNYDFLFWFLKTRFVCKMFKLINNVIILVGFWFSYFCQCNCKICSNFRNEKQEAELASHPEWELLPAKIRDWAIREAYAFYDFTFSIKTLNLQNFVRLRMFCMFSVYFSSQIHHLFWKYEIIFCKFDRNEFLTFMNVAMDKRETTNVDTVEKEIKTNFTKSIKWSRFCCSKPWKSYQFRSFLCFSSNN